MNTPMLGSHPDPVAVTSVCLFVFHTVAAHPRHLYVDRGACGQCHRDNIITTCIHLGVHKLICHCFIPSVFLDAADIWRRFVHTTLWITFSPTLYLLFVCFYKLGVSSSISGEGTCGMQLYADLFKENHITGKRLLLLTENDMRDMGVKSKGHVMHLKARHR